MNAAERWQVLVAALISVILLYLLAPVLTPFVISALLAYLADPLADKLEARKVPRTGAVLIVFVLLVLILVAVPLLMLPLVERQVEILSAQLPQYFDRIQDEFLPWLKKHLGIDLSRFNFVTLRETISTHWQEMGGVAGAVWQFFTRSGMVILEVAANLVLIPVLTFYLLRDWDVLMARIRELLPRRIEPNVSQLASEVDQVLGAFLRGQLLVMLGLGIIYTIGLWIIGLDLALTIGMIAGLVSFVPYLGFVVGILLAGIAALMQFGDWLPLVYVVIVFGVGQTVEGTLLTPLLVGDRIGLHPVAVIFAVLAGGQLFGFFGILLALPVAAIIMVLLRHVHRRYTSSDLYSRESGPP